MAIPVAGSIGSSYRIERAADSAGARAVLVHAIDEKAKSFYEYFEFEATSVDPRTLVLHMKDLRAMMLG